MVLTSLATTPMVSPRLVGQPPQVSGMLSIPRIPDFPTSRSGTWVVTARSFGK